MHKALSPDELKTLRQLYMIMTLEEFIEYLIDKGFSLEDIEELIRKFSPRLKPDRVQKFYATIIRCKREKETDDEEKKDGTEPSFP